MIEGNTAFQEATSTWAGPKKWADISPDEKIERLRHEMDGWRRECTRLRERLNLLESHKHDANGELLIELKQVDRLSSQGACASFNTLA